MLRRRIAVAMCVAVVLAMGMVVLQGQGKGTLSPVTIEVPGFTGDSIAIHAGGAWPLTIRMVANNPMGIGTYEWPYQLPVDGRQQGFVVFADPDGCFSLSRMHDEDLYNPETQLPPLCPGGHDETYLEFAASINHPLLAKSPVEKVPALELGGKPLLMGFRTGGNLEEFWMGPETGTLVDNYGYGSSPNVPGLVILSDTGVGQVWDPGTFDLVTPKVARNLAGFVNSVSYALNDCSPAKFTECRTSVTAHLNVPEKLFVPVVRVDWNYPDNWGSTDPEHPVGLHTNVYYRIDGAPWNVDPKTPMDLYAEAGARVATVRVFVVSGRAPDQFVDLDGDGLVTAKDARLAGYNVLSGGDKIISLKTTFEGGYHLTLGTQYDRDGNGMVPPPAPGGGGGIGGIPR